MVGEGGGRGGAGRGEGNASDFLAVDRRVNLDVRGVSFIRFTSTVRYSIYSLRARSDSTRPDSVLLVFFERLTPREGETVNLNYNICTRVLVWEKNLTLLSQCCSTLVLFVQPRRWGLGACAARTPSFPV